MKCPYCAEEIQADARICRYCFAEKIGDSWKPPGNMHSGTPNIHPSRFNIRFAAFFFFLSAAIELSSISDSVSFFGVVQPGMLAQIYHVVFIALFSGIGYGMWSAKPWGFNVVLGGSVFYTLDRILYFLDGGASRNVISQYGTFLGPEGQSMVSSVVALIVGLSLIGWWGFVFYLYLKRDYFQTNNS